MSDITIHNVTPDIWSERTTECQHLIDTEEKWLSVPMFNYVLPMNVKNQQLVRYRGMIQNTHNPEFFLSEYEVRNTITGASVIRSGKLKDTIICEENEIFVENSGYSRTSERGTWLCVPIPALNEWVKTNWRKSHMKRQHCQSGEESEPAKRLHSDVEQQMQDPSTNTSASELILPEPHSRACYAKLYDLETDSYVLNDEVEFVGFVSFNNDRKEETDNEMELDGLDDLKVPWIHVVACRSLLKHSCLHGGLLQDAREEEIPLVRNDLHLLLTQLLLGDTLAADYFLCHLLSSVYSRTDMMALGQLPLNIINIPKDNYVKSLYNIMELLVMKSLFLPLSLENLNEKEFLPRKDYEKDQLCPGLLQLSPHTHLVLDETQMQPGKLEVLGVTNMTALRKLVLEQKVAYDFKFYQLDFNCDLPVLVFSEGKSLLPCLFVLPLEADAACLQTIPEIFQAAHHFLQPSMLHRIRSYIFSVHSKFKKSTISSEMNEVMQEEFVKLRQNKDLTISPEDFHNLIVFSRLMSLSFGEPTLTAKTWERSLKLEMQRKQRLAHLTTIFLPD